MARDVPRLERATEAAELRAQGLLLRQIADHMHLSTSYVSSLLLDPDGSKDAARKQKYGGTCADCGGPTYGGEGRANAPRYCLACFNKRRRPEHGTYSRYGSGCSCDDCRRANRDYSRSRQGQEPPNHGTYSGYVNYGCRCDACSAAHRDYQWLHPEWRQRWEEKVRGIEPPHHGTRFAYNVYRCRCNECRAANAQASREWRAKRKAAA